MENLPAIFLRTVGRLGERTAAQHFEGGHWRESTWSELEERARARAAGLLARGIRPGDRVALMAQTSLDWIVCELAIHFTGAVCVPIYATLLAEDIAYLVNDSGSRLAFVQGRELLTRFEEKRPSMPDLEGVILMEGEGDGEWVSDLPQLRQQGERHLADHPEGLEERLAGIQADDVAHFIYTSGTTGPPKGVVLTHANWAFEAKATEAVGLVGPEDQSLAFLPLAHSYAQVLKTVWFTLGHPTCFARDLTTIVEDMAHARPTVMAGVPRIFEKVHAKIVATGMASPGLKGVLFAQAMRQVDAYAAARRSGRRYASPGFFLMKRLVFTKLAARLKELFGGRLRFFVSGGAPLSPTIAYFFELCGVEILEGYGLTETSAASTVCRPGRNKIGTVGIPVPGVEVKIAEDGEVLIRGPHIMRGYHGKPEATAEVLEPDGWFHSGDIGRLDDEGYLKITDRKKDLIVTAGGKNIAPQNIENRLKAYPLISQAVVHGDRRKFLTALVTLDEEAAAKVAEEARSPARGLAELSVDSAVKAAVAAAVADLNGSLASYETIKKHAILPYELSQEGGELTPSLKVKRRVLETRHAELLDGFYDEKY
ncbi:MAG: long-chain fatty acid--CoA ligase [Deltaproteobacteria bacterium]|nr:long-chain fatty acid--CoA ligase [Deltaproteobacteria bacterium]